ncbi:MULTISPECIES: bifunctional [glutamine synthetase] adenylyltransferase/[glutamine synthetase]-adenylyl-L-tyrosine phosphorylase [Thermomonospora]|uniref:Bifunctional glutamine synthetase adenylyltransferase/adenylyl-removing enzyme n=1 Tax=Thermomonospora curvata (strain ATCC 19995 / DSM 43183 / JCM 3096 / KCTC 9072 / NBRC 15933 / NCIMB 10081 / Henssen B9) TaxID=471852 RepID=D1A909_THECD|nr:MULTISPECIES: bifunctional [glutamine synthetase] adenylyltransferase/[glutamine synthetase]-adenylyl-L-tyrosine phosphorylase [Thermomonospora]ACY98647.1 (Glutamate--ammonia-ligase) adenylyltransferase [Thermomonospora curvata DSM 43183]PKK13774.1 MAG: bifunctional glutamine-synthetase adenylyltransferase/deadenyltransferase [Thermomonospora sp. CIF 1]
MSEPWTSERRPSSLTGRLARLGFTDAGRAERLLAEAAAEGVTVTDAMLDALGGAADPDLALSSLLRLLGELDAPERAALQADEGLRRRLPAVLGVSAALGEHLARHPGDWRVLSGDGAIQAPDPRDLRDSLLRAVGADPADPAPTAADASTETLVALRAVYRRHLLHLAGRDLTGVLDVGEVAAELADLASAALEAGLAVARTEVPEADSCRLAVIGMGKCGGRELNYVSDVDVIFVAEPRPGHDETEALRAASRLASGLMRACSASTPEGALWEVDAALRPEGKAGPLVRTLASHRAYYERWAKTWEFQALLKARPVAGDMELGADYIDAIAPLVWKAAAGEEFVEDIQAMRRRVEEHLYKRTEETDRQLKLGPGGLRDVEFAVQLLQLVHGRADETLRSRGTLEALSLLSEGGYVGRDDAAGLASAYRFLRNVEHLLQLHRLRRTHTVPDDPADLRRLGRALGLRTDPVGEFTRLWRRHARTVRTLHEKLFYRPLLRAVARLPEEEARLTPEAARTRLVALGFTDPAGALRHIQALTSGVSRRAAIQRTLLPVMLGWFASAPDPDAGLLGFRQVSDALGTTPWYLRLLRDDVTVAERMAKVLASSRYATDLLLRAPEAVAILGNDAELAPRPFEALLNEALAAVRRREDDDRDAHASAEDAVAAVRGLRRRELFRISVGDLLGLIDVRTVGEALTDIATVTIEAALQAAINKIEMERRGPLPTRITVVAMGRFGGRELGYGSDADVMFVHDPLPGADERDAQNAAHAVAEEMRRLLSRPAPDPPLQIDPNLRPEGKAGPLVRTLASYEAYYSRWSSPWEAQALLRADPVIGDAELGHRFRALIDPIRWPRDGISDAALREIRRLKARMESERLPHGVERRLHTKLGPGGLSDVEWVAQLLQLQHAHEVAGLRTTSTLAALDAAVEAGLLDPADGEVLSSAWKLATRIRGTMMLVRGKASDLLPTDHHRERTAVTRVLGYPGTGDLLEDYRRHARRARRVMERVFYGISD